VVAVAAAGAHAAPWTFDPPVAVSDAEGAGIFHHLESAGRRSLAVSVAGVAVVWEDNRSGAPQAYLALRPAGEKGFGSARRISTGAEAFEPVVAALPEGRFLLGWEQDGGLWLRVADGSDLGPAVRLGASSGRQLTLEARPDGGADAVWAADTPQGQTLLAASIGVGRGLAAPEPADPVAVSPVPERAFQGYPSLTRAADGALVLAWEDRRHGHTRLLHSRRETDGGFAAARQLNEHNAPTSARADEPAHLGSGVMRVALAPAGPDRILAVWLDKRTPSAGYAVWGAASEDGGRTFGPNARVHDALGTHVAQWHAALAGHPDGPAAAAWDDAREGWAGDGEEGGDLWLAWPTGDGWSPNLAVPGASGPGYQGDPVLAVDAEGHLHVAWIERAGVGAPSRILYLRGRRPSR